MLSGLCEVHETVRMSTHTSGSKPCTISKSGAWACKVISLCRLLIYESRVELHHRFGVCAVCVGADTAMCMCVHAHMHAYEMYGCTLAFSGCLHLSCMLPITPSFYESFVGRWRGLRGFVEAAAAAAAAAAAPAAVAADAAATAAAAANAGAMAAP